MKQKGTRILLAALVLLVWGGVLGRAMKRPSNDGALLSAPATPRIEEPVPEPPVAYSLARDPFLDDGGVKPRERTTRSTGKATMNRKPDRKKDVASKPVPTAHTSEVVYLGFLKNVGKEGATCVLLRVDGKDRVQPIGKESMGITVLRASATEVVLEQQGVEQRIAR